MEKSVAASLIALVFAVQGESAEKRNPLMGKESLVWAGIDYSMEHFNFCADSVQPNDFSRPFGT